MAILLMVNARKTCEVTSSVINITVQATAITRMDAAGTNRQDDLLAVEEPLEIRLRWQLGEVWQEEPLTITMRTPGHDAELATGLLFSEGIVTQCAQIVAMDTGENPNTLTVQLAAGHQLDLKRFQRNFYSTSSCGVCGKMAIESLRLLHEPRLSAGFPWVKTTILQQMPDTLRAAQPLFAQTGGVHAAGLFDTQGALLLLREDIGRHNAVDKLIGACRKNNIVLTDKILLVSGRAGFELVQKALVADIAFMASVGAPSSLAVEMALAHGMTLVGFLKRNSLNCYSGDDRLGG
jgi:FdhD protein